MSAAGAGPEQSGRAAYGDELRHEPAPEQRGRRDDAPATAAPEPNTEERKRDRPGESDDQLVDVVQDASAESFPASDPPAWIKVWL